MSILTWTLISVFVVLFIFGCFFFFVFGKAMEPIPKKTNWKKDWPQLLFIPVMAVIGVFLFIPVLVIGYFTQPKKK